MSLKHIPQVTMLLALSACASGAGPDSPFQPAPATRRVVVSVENRGDTDVAIYAADANRGRRRIGTVMRASAGNLVIPTDVLSWWDTELVAVPVGGGAASRVTCPRIEAGTRLVLVIERESALSNCARNRGAP